MTVFTAWPDSLFSPHAPPGPAQMETEHGVATILACARWHLPADATDRVLLTRCRGPVVDIGCGPGRHVAALADAGWDTLGIDTSPSAVATTRARGAQAVQVSIFDDVPRTGEWRTALLLDGNIGIGGDVTRLLARVCGLLAADGRILVETAHPAAASGTARVRIRHVERLSEWFPWAWVTPDELRRLATSAGLVAEDTWHLDDRWFVQLRLQGRRSG